jgi:hypothetical protein
MAKREIIRAAKKAGMTVTSAENYWTPTPGEMVREWEVRWSHDSGQYDDDVKHFATSAEAVEYFAALAQPDGVSK